MPGLRIIEERLLIPLIIRLADTLSAWSDGLRRVVDYKAGASDDGPPAHWAKLVREKAPQFYAELLRDEPDPGTDTLAEPATELPTHITQTRGMGRSTDYRLSLRSAKREPSTPVVQRAGHELRAKHEQPQSGPEKGVSRQESSLLRPEIEAASSRPNRIWETSEKQSNPLPYSPRSSLSPTVIESISTASGVDISATQTVQRHSKESTRKPFGEAGNEDDCKESTIDAQVKSPAQASIGMPGTSPTRPDLASAPNPVPQSNNTRTDTEGSLSPTRARSNNRRAPALREQHAPTQRCDTSNDERGHNTDSLPADNELQGSQVVESPTTSPLSHRQATPVRKPEFDKVHPSMLTDSCVNYEPIRSWPNPQTRAVNTVTHNESDSIRASTTTLLTANITNNPDLWPSLPSTDYDNPQVASPSPYSQFYSEFERRRCCNKEQQGTIWSE